MTLFLLGAELSIFTLVPGLQGTEHLVASGNDLVTFLQAASAPRYLCSRNAGLHRHELCLLITNHEYTLHVIVLLYLGCSIFDGGAAACTDPWPIFCWLQI